MPCDHIVLASQWHSHIILFTIAISLHVATDSDDAAQLDVRLWSFLDTALS